VSLDDILGQLPARSIDDVVALMQAIDGRLPDADGVKWFNRLYLRVTLGVRSAVADAAFRDAAFLAALDVAFANLYFTALQQADTGASVPAAWRPLFRARSTPGIKRIQFALAGMNAHINRDLPEGIVQAFRALGGSPLTDRARHQDFEAVNDILARVEDSARVDLSIGLIGAIDDLGGTADDAIAMWKVRAARAAAWTNAKVLWVLQEVPALRDDFFSRLDSLTGLAGQGLLHPSPLSRAGISVRHPEP